MQMAGERPLAPISVRMAGDHEAILDQVAKFLAIGCNVGTVVPVQTNPISIIPQENWRNAFDPKQLRHAATCAGRRLRQCITLLL